MILTVDAGLLSTAQKNSTFSSCSVTTTFVCPSYPTTKNDSTDVLSEISKIENHECKPGRKRNKVIC